ncbi:MULTISPECIES: hypothetical protein [unclassified Microcoleus]|uniref:hypothetical protein n=1 Tax=unclassified Microcoleus TaxID=2642155 RepID=UPI002FD7793B
MGSCSQPEKYNLDARQLTDVTKIYQCLLSLLSNASKFTEAGEITIANKFGQIIGGDISLESELGKGSIFTIKLP